MKLMDWLKWVLPKPQLQKRYIAIAGIILYCAAKAYVEFTPSEHDDACLDHLRDAVVLLLADNQAATDNDSMAYGEED